MIREEEFKVLGLRVDKYVEEYEDLGWSTDHRENETTHLFATRVGYNGPIVDISLKESIGPCGSGYCMSSWGHMSVERVNPDDVGPLTHRPIGQVTFKALCEIQGPSIKLEPLERKGGYIGDLTEDFGVFSYSVDGGDDYYPCGGIFVDMSLFEELPRAMTKMPVWIFKGASGLGKSTLANIIARNPSFCEDYAVLETDKYDELPDMIWQSIVVIGNRNKFTVDDITSRLFNGKDKWKVIVVNFEEAE